MVPVIRLDKVTKRFGAEVALNDVSLEVAPGVVFALLGESGQPDPATVCDHRVFGLLAGLCGCRCPYAPALRL